MEGTFGTRPVVVKRNVKVPLREDVNETIMQTRLFCHLRDRHPAAGDRARIPEAVFAATVPGFGRVLGMEKMDLPLLAHVRQLRTAPVPWLRDALAKVCRLLAILQDEFRFMHGDLHGENIMVKGTDVFLIDFGMASARFDRAPRMITNSRYDGVRFHPHLDLLTLLTALRDDLALSHHLQVAAWCDTFVEPFWSTVRAGLWSGPRDKLPFGSRRIVRNAIDEIQYSGEVYYAHHLLYEDIGKVAYPACEPRNMLRRLQTTQVRPGAVTRARFFEDI